MQVRHAIAAVTVAAFALTLSACTSDPAPSGSPAPSSPVASASPSPSASPEPTTSATAGPPAEVTIRTVTEGYDLASTANSLRTGFPSFEQKTDEEIELILNAGCDAIDATGTPEAAADTIQSYGIELYDAAFSVSAAIVLYCPEYSPFLGG
jgi:hypothetical protein